MNDDVLLLMQRAQKAMTNKDWPLASTCCDQLLQLSPDHPDAHYLTGLVSGSIGNLGVAVKAFSRAYELDSSRADVKVQLARCKVMTGEHCYAEALIDSAKHSINDRASLLDVAATVYSHIGKQEKAWPLYLRASRLGLNSPLHLCNLASCAIFLGKVDEAKTALNKVLRLQPRHHKAHWQLSRLSKAKDHKHIKTMEALLEGTSSPKDNFLHYALGKEYEDLRQWKEAWRHYQTAAGITRKSVNYDRSQNTELVDTIITGCDRQWFTNCVRGTQISSGLEGEKKQAIFIVGLPRTGTTLVERILSSHSSIESVGELQFFGISVKRAAMVSSRDSINAEIIREALTKPIGEIADDYMQAADYLFGDKPLFVDKLPHNFFYLGFIAKAFPTARIVHLRRHPLDTCLAIYKQLFAGAYSFSYVEEELVSYYADYQRLMNHWRSLLGERLIEVAYEDLVHNQIEQTQRLLARVGVPFEERCLNFFDNQSPVATASASQVRGAIHSSSVGRWKYFSTELKSLKNKLLAAGVSLEY